MIVYELMNQAGRFDLAITEEAARAAAGTEALAAGRLTIRRVDLPVVFVVVVSGDWDEGDTIDDAYTTYEAALGACTTEQHEVKILELKGAGPDALALIDRVTNTVDRFIRKGGGTYDELQDVVEAAIAGESTDRERSL